MEKEKKKTGPKITPESLKIDNAIWGYRQRGFSFREIKKLTGLDVKSIYRRYSRVLASSVDNSI